MIAFEHVAKIYAKEIATPAHTALVDLTFTVKKGETLGLIGANGAGKSTCIKLLMDFIRPDAGAISILGQ
ncbi:MAG: ATP-binding cassette domain-containing protein, partial [Proteobacteria bacterium]|nr:ATP-binding cassette domain-containing protein [Pseudomonadota bacterium]